MVLRRAANRPHTRAGRLCMRFTEGGETWNTQSTEPRKRAEALPLSSNQRRPVLYITPAQSQDATKKK